MTKYLTLLPIILFSSNTTLNGQEYSKNSLKVGLGIGVNEGLNETGMGSLLSFGYQKSVLNSTVRTNSYHLNQMTLNFGNY